MFFMVLIIAGSCAMGQETVKAPIEPLYGSWVNPDFNAGGKQYPKITIRPDGTAEIYGHTDISEGLKGEYTIIDSWIDSDGNKYYKVRASLPYGGGWFSNLYELWRLNETDTVFEKFWDGYGYPTEMDPEHARYGIYYRQE